jgi:hypothetical protein
VGGVKIPAAAVVALLLVVGLAACGGDSGSEPDLEGFVPKQHHDSGGGVQQFKVTGASTVQGFGSEAKMPEFRQAATELHNFLDARAGHYWSAACVYIDKNLTQTLKEFGASARRDKDKSCGGVLEYLTKKDPKQGLLRAEAAQANAAAMRVKGTLGFLIYRGAEHVVRVMSMTRGGDGWKVDSLTGIPLTVG